MKYLQYIFLCVLSLLFIRCTESIDFKTSEESDNGAQVIGDKVILTTTIDVSDFKQVSTRAFSERAALDNLHLYLIEFIDNGSPLTNTLSAVYEATDETVEETVEGTVVKYNVTINKTDEPRILHLLAVPKDYDLDVPYGVEGYVMPSFTSENNIDAYWRRFEFENGYCTKVDQVNEETGATEEVWEPNQDLNDKLINKNVKLVRNFAKVTVGVADGIENFLLEGFIIVNTPLKGTMVPYSATNRLFPEFLDANGDPLPYETVAENYTGSSPANTTLDNQVTSEDAPDILTQETLKLYTSIEDDGTGTTTTKNWLCLDPVYLYERPFNSLSRTYVIVKGKYQSNTAEAKTTYYKLDLGKNDNNAIFRYYGLLRNFNYFIRINKVETNGYDSVAEAAEGTVYNNISFDIDTDHLMNMSDGKEIIRVNFTTAVITDPTENTEPLVFRYAYKTNIWENNGRFDNSRARFIDLRPGSVIESVSPEDPNTASDVNISTNGITTTWRQVKITCKDPTNITQTQSFTVVNTATGLGRTVTLVSHLKWAFEEPRQYAGIWENYPSTYKGLDYENTLINPDNLVDGKDGLYADKCGTEVGSQFTIFFDIPDNIPEALFPLVFTIESDQQGLENEPMGTIVVAPGPSLFSENGEDNRIQYNKSVTWTEYNAPLRTDVRDDNGTALVNPNGTTTHRVRCRFRTIETVTNGLKVRVRIANENFLTTTINFTRDNRANGLYGPGLVTQTPSNP